MSEEEKRLRRERDFVANRYGPHAVFWMERVARMSTDQVTAIYLSMKTRDAKKQSKPAKSPEEPPDDQLQMF